jgi:hypothetical protein
MNSEAEDPRPTSIAKTSSDATTKPAMGQIEETAMFCEECKQEFPCLTVRYSECEKVSTSSWLWEAPVGYTCANCCVARCNDCWQKGKVHFSLWNRWNHVTCSHCHQPFQPGLVFVWPQKGELLRKTLNDLGRPPFTGCRSAVKWTTRVFSLPLILTFSIVLIQALFSGDYPGQSDMITGLFALFALLVAWRWEIAGGGLMLLGTSVNACATKMREEPWGFYIGWMLAFLFLTSGALKLAVNPVATQKQVKAARILALVFALLALASLAGCFGLGAYKRFNG